MSVLVVEEGTTARQVMTVQIQARDTKQQEVGDASVFYIEDGTRTGMSFEG
jgi:hypothetical protein